LNAGTYNISIKDAINCKITFPIWTNAAISNDAHLEIRNANAQIVMSRKLNQSEQSGIKVNAKDWAAGVYFIMINNNGKLISEKVIKK